MATIAKKIKEFPRLFKRTSGGGVQIWDVWVESNGTSGFIGIRHGLLDGKQQTSIEEITQGKNTGKKNATTPTQQALSEAESRWNIKQERKGYGLTVGASAAIRSVSPMLAKSYDKVPGQKIQWGTALAQPKLDGFRCLARLNDSGKFSLTSRENQPLTTLAHIEAALGKLAISAGVTLDGELYKHGMPLNTVSSACKKKSELSEQIEYHIYDIFGGQEQPFRDRYAELRERLADLGEPAIILVDTVKVRTEDELMACQAEFLDRGYEGAMLRHGDAGYEAGKRSASLLKVKTFQDEEFTIIDWKMGRGKHANVPIFVCETEAGHTFDVTAPGTMAEKRKLGEDAAECVGKKLTVKFIYMTKTATPVPFLPVAKRLAD